MRRFLVLALLALLLSGTAMNVHAQELEAPALPEEAAQWMPEENASFGDGLKFMLQKGLPQAFWELHQAGRQALGVFACVLLVSILQASGCNAMAGEVAGAVGITWLMLRSSRTLISLAVDTVLELGNYSKLFLPVMAAAASARGAFTSAAALCLGTCVFTAFLQNVLCRVLVPGVYLLLAASVAGCALGDERLKAMKEQLKKLSTWFLKTTLAVFLTYMSITGAVTGAADKTAVKAAKAAISTVVPVIGKSLADASEALLLSAELVKNSLGVYGIFAFLAIFLSPFLRIGVQYLILKLTAALCGCLGSKRLAGLTEDFSAAMGLLLGMTAAMCALSVIGTVCFLKGVG